MNPISDTSRLELDFEQNDQQSWTTGLQETVAEGKQVPAPQSSPWS